MNEIDLLRRLRDTPAPSPATLAPSRARLLAHASGERGTARRRRTPLVLAVAAATVLVASLGLVLTNPFATPPAGAAGLLRRAAQHADGGPVPGPGRYLAVETHEDSLGYVEAGGRIVGAYRVASVSTTYVPHDRDGTWIRRSWSREPREFYGGAEVRRAAARDFASSAHADDPSVERARSGAFSHELGGGDGGLGPHDIATLPRDPRELLDRLERSGSVGSTRARAAMEGASTLLRSGLVPLDLRRSLFNALALVPDVRVVDHTVTLGGRTGTAIGVPVDDGVWSVVIDPATGDYLGDLETQASRVGAVPAGTVTYRTSVSLRVVDAPPTS